MIEYKELDVWLNGRKLVKLIYDLTKGFPDNEKFGLTNQIRRCSVSIPSNIAVGCGRQHTKETVNFLFIARGSLYELETQLFLCHDQNYLD